MQGCDDLLGAAHADPRDLGDLLGRRVLQPLQRPEVLQQRRAPRRPQTRYVIEFARRHGLGPPLPVEGDREPVRLVPDPLDEEHALAVARQDHRIVLAGQPQLLQPLGDAADRDVVDAQLVQRPLRGRDLRRAAVDEHEVGRVGELARPAGLRVDRLVRPLLRPAPGRRPGLPGLPGGLPVPLAELVQLARLLALGEVAPEPAGDDLVDGADVVLPLDGLDREAAVLALAGQAVLEHDHRRDHVGALQVRHVVALDAQRRLVQAERVLDLLQRPAPGGQVGRAARLVLLERLVRVALDGLQQRLLVAAPGDAQPHRPAALLRQQLGHRVLVGRQRRDEHLPRHRLALAVDLEEEVLDQVGGGDVRDLVDHPAALPADPAAAHVEHLDGRLQLVLREGDHVAVGAVGEDDRLLLQGARQRADVVAEARGALVLLLRGRLAHLAFEALDEPGRVARHEVAEVLGEAAVLLRGDAADARRRALGDVAEQAGPVALALPLEHPGAARPDGEHAQQLVDRLPDRPRVGVRPEVAHALALGSPHHHHPRVLLVQGDGQVRIGLVVAVADVEPGVELLDPGVLELEGLDLGGDDRPVDARGGPHHRLRPGMQRGEVGEVGVQPLAQVLRLAHVDDPAVLVTEPVHPGGFGDRARCGSVSRRISHAQKPSRRGRRAARA